MSQWYYARGDRQSGPVSSQKLKKLAETGWVLPNDLVWREGETERRPASSYPNLFPPPAAGPTPADRPQPGGQAPEDAPRRGGSFLGFVGFLAALLSIALGGGASYLFWKGDHRPLVVPAAFSGLLLGNLVLLANWLRGRARFSLAVLGVTASAVALTTDFVDTGGLAKARNDVRQELAGAGTTEGLNARALGTTGAAKADPSGTPRRDTSSASTPAGASGANEPSSEAMTRNELIAKIEALGNPCARQHLYQAVGHPQKTEMREGRLAGLVWTWTCKDGAVEAALLNPDVGDGEHTDRSLAYVSKLTEK